MSWVRHETAATTLRWVRLGTGGRNRPGRQVIVCLRQFLGAVFSTGKSWLFILKYTDIAMEFYVFF